MTRNHERDHEVLQAFVKTSRDLGKKIEISFGHHQIGLSYDEIDTFLAILNALPEPPNPLDDDVVDAVVWEECEFDDFHPTDERVRAVFHYNDTIIEGKPTGLFSHGRVLGLGSGVQIKEDDEAIFYRIPAPIKHPDPDKDLVILDGDGSIWFRSGYGDEYHSPTDFTYFKHPADFTDWSPAKVVADDE